MADLTISAEEFETWIPVNVAYQQAGTVYGSFGCSHILKHLKSGLMLARAEHLYVEPDSKKTDHGLKIIPTGIWDTISNYEAPYQCSIWATNAADVTMYSSLGSHSVKAVYKLFGVRFDPKGVKAMMPPVVKPSQPPATPPAPSPSPASAPTKHAGGAPDKGIWEKVWIEVAARLYSGDLKPEKQKDIEDAIVEIVMSLGKDCSEATARRRAKPLWDKINKGS